MSGIPPQFRKPPGSVISFHPLAEGLLLSLIYLKLLLFEISPIRKFSIRR